VLEHFIARRAGVFLRFPNRPKPIVCRPSRRWMTFSKPMNAPRI